MEPRRTLTSDVDTPAVRIRGIGGPDVVVAAWEAHYGEIYAFLVRATRDMSEAEDLLQETFTRLARETRAGRTPAQVRPWLYRVASNLAVSRGRRTTTARRWVDAQNPREYESRVSELPEASALRHERTVLIERAMGQVSPDARVALLLASQGFRGEEIAATIGRSHNATRALLTRTRVQLRMLLEGEDLR